MTLSEPERKKRSNTQLFSAKNNGQSLKGHVSGHASVHHVSCGMLLGRSWCFLGDGSSCHSDDNRVLCTQGEKC